MESAADLMRYLDCACTVAAGALLAIADLRRIRRPVFGVVLTAGVVGGLIITRPSPFTSAGGDHYMEGVILFAGSALALADYVANNQLANRASPLRPFLETIVKRAVEQGVSS
jgi:hypothetical protein